MDIKEIVEWVVVIIIVFFLIGPLLNDLEEYLNDFNEWRKSRKD